MKRKDQKRIVKELLGSLAELVLAKLPRIPEDWDGHELRQWIADVFTANFVHALAPGRKREYKNTVLVYNLD